MSVTVTYESKCTIAETLENNVAFSSATKKIVTHDLQNTSKTLNSGSSPPATKDAVYKKALAAGVATIDLTALPQTGGGTQDLTGLKVQLMKFKNISTNNLMTVTKGAANGYGMTTGGATWTMPIAPGDEFTISKLDTAPDVAAGAKNIDIAGTGTEELEVTIVAG